MQTKDLPCDLCGEEVCDLGQMVCEDCAILEDLTIL